MLPQKHINISWLNTFPAQTAAAEDLNQESLNLKTTGTLAF